MIDSDPVLFIKSLFLALVSVPFFKCIWLSRCQKLERIAFGVYLAVHPSSAFIRYLYFTRERTYSSCWVSVAPPARTADGDRAALNHKPHLPYQGLGCSRPSTDESTQILSCYFSMLHSRGSGLQIHV